MALPAILGGRPAVTAGHDEANRWPRLDERDERAVLRVLRDGNLSTHPVIRELEADYAALAGVPHALAHANGTAALHAAFFALDLQPGDEVLVPSATFWASVLPIVWAGAVFAKLPSLVMRESGSTSFRPFGFEQGGSTHENVPCVDSRTQSATGEDG